MHTTETVKVKNSSPPPTVGQLLADRLPTDYQQLTNSLPTGYQQSLTYEKNCRPTLGRQLANCRPTVGQLSANCRPTVGRLSADSWPTVGGGELFFTFTTETIRKCADPLLLFSFQLLKSSTFASKTEITQTKIIQMQVD